MAKVVGDVAVRVGADVGPLGIGLAKGTRSLRKFEKSGKRMGARMARSAKVAAVGIAAMATAFTIATRKVITSLDNIGKTADKIGLSTDALQELRFAAEIAGVEVSVFDKAMQRSGTSMSEARDGLKTYAIAFDKLGVELFTQDGQIRNLEDVFLDFAEALSKVEDVTERNGIAFKVFGARGLAMVNMLRDGSAGLANMRQEAHRLGIVIRQESVRAAEELNDKLTIVTHQLKTGFSEALISVAPLLIEFAEKTVALARGLQQIAGGFKAVGAGIGKLGLARELDILRGAAPGGAYPGPGAQLDPAQFARDLEGFDSGKGVPVGQLGFVDKNGKWVGYGSAADTGQMDPARFGGGNIIPPGGGGSGFMDQFLNPQAIDNFNRNRAAMDGMGDGGGGSVLDGIVPTDADFEFMQSQFETARERITAFRDEQLADLRAFRENKLGTEEQFDTLEEQIIAQHHDRLQALQQARTAATLRGFQGMFGDLATLMSSSNKKLFAIGKAAAMAEAVISGYSAAVDAWAKGMKIGGPWMAAAFTAASLAKTGALISQIAGTTASGGSSSQANVGGSGVPTASAPATRATNTAQSRIGRGDADGLMRWRSATRRD